MALVSCQRITMHNEDITMSIFYKPTRSTKSSQKMRKLSLVMRYLEFIVIYAVTTEKIYT